ncbi:ComEA family DNA-binding protein [Methylobacterium sp. E-045]|uniref:ComEA family DNA-binding protein n=1 Tax=Methylobacterium sp. E-045 TaxID=2836575 RepID=UPI001FBC12F1|nr:helix-hairpin-helix domain-containing protein [Methylobacterium sp. E-045]MCJ2130870.1 helix-hairpin-helix domain-containing protein [Methylobacterium sp. E-045]
MLSGSTLLRVVVLFVVAAALAGLVQAFWPQGGDDQAPPVQRTEPTKATPQPPAPAPPERRAEPAPSAPQPAAPQPAVPAPAAPVPAAPQAVLPPSPIRPLPRQTLPTPPEGASSTPNPAPLPYGGPVAPLAESPPLTTLPSETQQASDNAGPAAVSVVDLNTASVAELNGLKGGGMIGRAIAQRRPYASVDQLLSKRVLSRSTYERIKNQVTVR